MTSTTIHIAAEHGAILTGRRAGAEIARAASERARSGAVVLDFTDVEAVAPSIADELFGKLRTRIDDDRLCFTNLSPHLRDVAQMAESRRAAYA
jgi:hypothetical protein